MNRLKKIAAGTLASGLLAAGLVAGPTIVASPESGAVQSASAASWLPTKPSTRQPVGWGSTCAIVTHRYWWGGRYTAEYRWFTTSLGGSSCLKYRVW